MAPQVNSFQKQTYAPINEPVQKTAPQNVTPSIKAPVNVQDILNRLHNSETKPSGNNTSETQDDTSSNNDRIVNSSSLNTSERKKGGRKKKEIMTII